MNEVNKLEKRSVYILGLSAFYHDSAASLIKNGEITVGTLRLRKENNAIKLERMAILSKFRKMSFGIKAINEIKKYCVTEGESKIFLDSIYGIRDFYKKCGFSETGSIFERVGLPHIRMELSIQAE